MGKRICVKHWGWVGMRLIEALGAVFPGVVCTAVRYLWLTYTIQYPHFSWASIVATDFYEGVGREMFSYLPSTWHVGFDDKERSIR